VEIRDGVRVDEIERWVETMLSIVTIQLALLLNNLIITITFSHYLESDVIANDSPRAIPALSILGNRNQDTQIDSAQFSYVSIKI